MTLVLKFSDRSALDTSSAGGKGANLARLTQAGLSVPDGFVVTAEAYSLFAAGAADLLAEVNHSPFDDPAALEEHCRHLTEQLASRAVPDAVVVAVCEQLDLLGLTTPVAVRSSATTEDSGGAAFAGQHATYLNVSGLDEVLDRIRDCWVSLWSSRAMTYRRHSGFSFHEARMAVVVQRLAFCDVAGVGFSFNPVTGNLGEQVFDANYGLGESVVAGEAQIDHFVVDKATGLVISAEIAEKSEKVVPEAAGSGTRIVALKGEERAKSCLSGPQIVQLHELLLAAERLYGFPQDIEWGFESGTLRILQSRPITRIPARWTRDESAERFPTVITPLAWALVESGFHESLRYSFRLMGMPPFHGKWFAMFDHYIYGNQNAVEVYANGAAASMLKMSSLQDFAAAVPLLRERYSWVFELPVTWARDLDRYLIGIGELMAEDLDDRSTQELWRFVLRVRDLGADYFLPNIAISITQRTLHRVLHGLLKIAVGPQQAPVVLDRLLAHCETKTGAINKELHRFAQRIAQYEPLVARLEKSSGAEFLAGGGFAGFPELDTTFRKFLRDHGHREVDFDPYHPTWLDAPDLVIENLKAMLHGARQDPAEKERELKIVMMETETEIVNRAPPELRFAIREIIRLTRVYTTLDDVEHYQTTRLTLPLRKGLQALGQRLEVLGVVDDPQDIYFAEYEALDQAVKVDSAARWHELRLEIQAEKAAYLQHKGTSPTWNLREERTDTNGGSKEGQLTGLAGSPGSARGPVFRVFGSEDFGRFPSGAVLVARTTNPAWTPLFFKAAAVVTECGGPLSHGAVTAREIGLPAVMAVRDALATLADGDVVTVNGTAGCVLREAPLSIV